LVAIWKVWRGSYIIDRLIALDVSGTLVLAVLVLIAIVKQDSIFIDIAIGIAALSAISTINLARYFAQEKIF
jgi:multicomponent Na+:H+ antiporter subunit F